MYTTWRVKIQSVLWSRWTVIIAVLTVAGTVGVLAAKDKITDKIGLALAAVVGIFYFLLQGKRAYWLVLCIGIATTAIGHHGVYVTSTIYLVALEIVLFALCAILFFESVASGEPIDVKLPIALTFMTVWAILHALATVLTLPPSYGDPYSLVIGWALTFAIGFPAFFVVDKIVKHEWQVVHILKITMAVSLVMSIFGILEYYFPSIARLLGDAPQSMILVAQDGFRRALFSFWGYPAAASIITWGMVIAFDQFGHGKTLVAGVIALVVFAVDSLAVYISGQRSSWIALPLSLVIVSLNVKRRILLSIGAMLVVVVLLPGDFWNRMATLSSIILKGEVVDTSTQSRLNRWQSGIDDIIRNPLTGTGYGTELLHNAVLEIGSRLGVMPGVVFVIFLIQLVLRILRCIGLPVPNARRYGLLFLALAVPWFMQMAVETDLQTPPFAAPQWVFLALAWFLPDILRGQPTAATQPVIKSTTSPELLEELSV